MRNQEWHVELCKRCCESQRRNVQSGVTQGGYIGMQKRCCSGWGKFRKGGGVCKRCCEDMQEGVAVGGAQELVWARKGTRGFLSLKSSFSSFPSQQAYKWLLLGEGVIARMAEKLSQNTQSEHHVTTAADRQSQSSREPSSTGSSHNLPKFHFLLSHESLS